MALKELIIVFLLIFVTHKILNNLVMQKSSPTPIIEEDADALPINNMDNMKDELMNFIVQLQSQDVNSNNGVHSASPSSDYADAAFGNTSTDLSKYFAEKRRSAINDLPSTLRTDNASVIPDPASDTLSNVPSYMNRASGGQTFENINLKKYKDDHVMNGGMFGDVTGYTEDMPDYSTF